MKFKVNNVTIPAILFLALTPSCKDNPINFITPKSAPVNLIQNPSFEANGRPSLQSWWISDTILSEIFQNAPPRGGKWSLALYPGWLPEQCFARTYVLGQSGTGIFQLTVLMRNNSDAYPRMALGCMVHGQFVCYKSATTDSTNWTTVSIIDTMSLQPNDTLVVQFSGGSDEIGIGGTLFDVVNLQRVQ